MNKIYSTILLFTLAVLLSSCLWGGEGMLIVDDGHKKADDRMKQISEAIENDNREVLPAMFSRQALAEADNFEENLDALFGYVLGDIQSWKRAGAFGGAEGKNVDGTGNHTKEFEAIFILSTSEQEYHIAIYECTIDVANPDNVGLYSFCVISASDYTDTEHSYWGNREAGINIG